MKTWTVAELKNVVRALKALEGLRLQEILTSEQDVLLGFYSTPKLLWLWVDLNPVRPCLLPWGELPVKPVTKKTPLHLFMRAHFVGQKLISTEIKEEQGRVVEMHFTNDRRAEIRLFPHGRNFLLWSEGKHLSLLKPSELPLHAPSASVFVASSPERDLEALRDEWLQQKGKSKSVRKMGSSTGTGIATSNGSATTTSGNKSLDNDLSKKQKALEKVRAELERKKSLPWREIGEWIKSHQSLNVPADWEIFIDKRRKTSWNIEQCFAKARESEGKIRGTEARVQILLREIASLEKRIAESAHPATANLKGRATTNANAEAKDAADIPKPTHASTSTSKSTSKSTPAPAPVQVDLQKIAAQARTLRVRDDLMAIVGKSAADNLKILRRARAWDLWMHMRDYPSSHAVLFRNKNAKVSDADLNAVAAWFVRHHLGNKAAQSAQHSGQKFELIICECRHVHPIKGDKIGRVTFRNERTLIFRPT